MNSLYHPHIMDHYTNPRLNGTLKEADFIQENANPLCGDSVSISGQIQNGILTDIRFESAGCVLVQSAASMLCDKIKGVDCKIIMQLSEKDIIEMMNISLGPNRMQCVILPLKAVKKGIATI